MATDVLLSLFDVLRAVLFMLQLLIIASVIVSWVGGDPSNTLVRFIKGVTEPMYRPVRRLTSAIPGPLDWAPLVLLLLIFFLDRLLIRIAASSGGGF